MDVRQMRQLLAIHRNGGFVKAADELGISQPALSRSIARLEDQLRITLFERSRAGAVATPLCLALIERADRLVTESQRLSRDIELIAAGQIGEVRIGVGPSLRPALPAVALALIERFPRLRVSLNADSRRPLIEGLVSGRLDLIAVGAGPDLDDPELVYEPVLTERMVAVARPGHPLAGRSDVSLDEFVAYPTISPFKAQVFSALDPALQSLRRSDPPPAYITNDAATVEALIVEAGATHIASEHVVAPWLAAGRVVRIDLRWRWELTTNIVMTRASIHSPVVARCATIVSDVCRKVIAPRDQAFAGAREGHAPEV